MAAVFHLNPAFEGTRRRSRQAASDRLPALLRGAPRSRSQASPTRFRAHAQSADSWPQLEFWLRRCLWLAVSVVIAVDLIGTFVLNIR